MSVKTILGLTVAAAGVLGLLAGCTSHGPKMKVGVVNTARIVAEHPDYQSINIQWMEERVKMQSMVPADPDALSVSERNALQQKLQKEADARSKEFDKLARDFMQKMQDGVKQSAEAVAKQKGIDLVIIDTPGYPTVLYNSGENITTDILLRMK